ncbi:hypothetical protein Drorol1_Dr00013580 [Drosera rotundifolia]
MCRRGACITNNVAYTLQLFILFYLFFLLRSSQCCPGFSVASIPEGQEKEAQAKRKCFLTIMDSMTNEELDSTNLKHMNESWIMRIARGSGRLVGEVMQLLDEYKLMAKRLSMMTKGLKIPKNGDMSAMSRNMNAQQISNVIPPDMLRQFGGTGGLQMLLKQMGSFNGGGK